MLKKNKPQPPNSLFMILLLVGYCIYGFLLILRSSFEINGTKYFVLFDDMMISMRYAKNFANGHGLVWNVGGEHVEGFTNLLWVLYMSIFHFMQIPQQIVSFPIQLTGIFCMIGTLYFVKKISDFLSNNSFLPFLFSVLLTASYFPLNNWNIILGTEVSILTLIITIVSYLSLLSIRNKTFYVFVFILLAIGILIRFDVIVPASIVTILLFVFIKKIRKQILLIGLPILSIGVLSQTLFRLLYYKELLPNTYYLKMTGFPIFLRIARGFSSFLEFILGMNWILFLIPFLLLVKKNIYVLFLSGIIIGQFIYSIYVGGDAWEYFGGSNRYITIIMPLFFVLFGYSVETILQKIITRPVTRIMYLGIISFILYFSVFSFNNVSDDTLEQMFLIKQPSTVGGNKINVERALYIDSVTTSSAKIGVVWAGTIPYFSNRDYIDFLGKNDSVIAKEEMHIFPKPKTFIDSLTVFYPGHLKWNYNYSINSLKPDIIAQTYPAIEALPYLNNYKKIRVLNKFDLYVRNTSSNVKMR